MTKCLVTGGAGFIGSHLVEGLLDAGHDVHVFDDFSTGKKENLPAEHQRLEIQRGCLSDRAAVEKAVRDCEIVFHLGALASVTLSIENPLASHEICATGTLHVLDAARRVGARRVVFAASSSAYGNAPGSVRRENDALDPLSPYAAAKLAGEHYCSSFTAAHGLETVRLRFFNIFGPRQDASSPYSGVIALFAKMLLEGRTPRIDGDGQQSRDFCYVANVVQALMKAAHATAASGNVYNIGTGRSTTIVQLVDHLNQLLELNVKAEHGPPRAGDVRHSEADISRARRDLGFAPEVGFAEGLRHTLEWYKTQR